MASDAGPHRRPQSDGSSLPKARCGCGLDVNRQQSGGCRFNLIEEWDMVTPQMVLRGAIARTGVRPFPLSLTYELSWLCNLSCGYCDRHTPMANELKREDIFKALETFIGLGMRLTNLDGGEALLHRNVDEIVEWLTQRGITV